MTEARFLEAVATYLRDGVTLDPDPRSVGAAEPGNAAALPALVLGLESLQRPRTGLGETGATVRDGALRWESRIDLSDPVLPGDPDFVLLSADRRLLTLHHGGLVRADGSSGPLGHEDLEVRVAGGARTVVADAPAADEVSADPTVGVLTFGAPLPGAGEVVVIYFVGQWERRVVRLRGVLRLDARDQNAGTAEQLSTAAADALLEPRSRDAIPGLVAIRLVEMDAVGPSESQMGNSRRRRLRLAFDFEDVIDRPDSSGGVIREVPLTTRLAAAAGGGMVED